MQAAQIKEAIIDMVDELRSVNGQTLFDADIQAVERWAREPLDHGVVSEDKENQLIAKTVVLRSQVAVLREVVLASKRGHYHCDDSWYCCGKCTHPDHGIRGVTGDLYPPSHEGEAARTSGICNCGADAWNVRVDEVLQRTRP